MTIAADLLQRHIHTLVADNAHWQTLITDDLVWELPYAPTIGHPARLAGREEVVGFVTWFWSWPHDSGHMWEAVSPHPSYSF
jgi:hypothetical protein